MKILSIDPGYERLGIAILEKNKRSKETVLYSDCFRTSNKFPFPERLLKIGNELDRVIKKYSPEVFVTESLFFTKNQKTALFVASAIGSLIYIAKKNNLKVFEYTPLQIKIAITGYGRSDKKQITSMVQKLVTIDKKIKLDDEYDAIAVGLTFFASERGLF